MLIRFHRKRSVHQTGRKVFDRRRSRTLSAGLVDAEILQLDFRLPVDDQNQDDGCHKSHAQQLDLKSAGPAAGGGCLTEGAKMPRSPA